MDNLLEALAKGMNISIDGISELLGSIKDNTPQLYEQLVREWTYYTVLGKSSGAMLIITGILMAYTLIFRWNLEVNPEHIRYEEIPKAYQDMNMQKFLHKRMLRKLIKHLDGCSQVSLYQLSFQCC